MRLRRFLNEEDTIKKALSMDEPEPNSKYEKDEVKSIIKILKDAIDAQKSKDTSQDSSKAILKDLKDKLDKWLNWKEETKSEGPNPPLAIDQLAAAPPEEGEG